MTVADRPPATVVVCAHTAQRWRYVAAALEALTPQLARDDDVILVIDHNEALLSRARAAFPDIRVLENGGERGLSGARNTGTAAATGAIVLYLDDDACPTPGWMQHMLEPFADRYVIGVGGVARPRWAGHPPCWLPAEFLWVVGCSYRGLPETVAEIRNPIGASMAFRREAFALAGGFSAGLGRVGMFPSGCEETEFAIRVRQVAPGHRILHVPTAVVDHVVTRERATWGYFTSRCWSEGRSKALVAAAVGATEALESERRYAMRTLPSGIWTGLMDAMRGDPCGVARAVAIVAGLIMTSGGYVAGRASARNGAPTISSGPVS